MTIRNKPYVDPSVKYVLKTSAPLTSDNHYPISTIWIDQTNDKLYQLTNIVLDVATWIDISGSGGSGTSISVTYSTSATTNLLDADLNKILLIESAVLTNINLPEAIVGSIGKWIQIYKMGIGNLIINANGTNVIEDSAAGGNTSNTVAAQTYANISLFIARTGIWKYQGAPLGSWSTT